MRSWGGATRLASNGLVPPIQPLLLAQSPDVPGWSGASRHERRMPLAKQLD